MPPPRGLEPRGPARDHALHSASSHVVPLFSEWDIQVLGWKNPLWGSPLAELSPEPGAEPRPV